MHVTDADSPRCLQRRIKTTKYRSVPLYANRSIVEVARFPLNRYDFEGVDINAGLTRNYPLGKSESHVIGYIAKTKLGCNVTYTEGKE